MLKNKNYVLLENNSPNYVKFIVYDYNSPSTTLFATDAIPPRFSKNFPLPEGSHNLIIKAFYLENGVEWADLEKSTIHNVKQLVLAANSPNNPLEVRLLNP
ncbi:MAG: hypothetical protein RR645_04060 [Clostridium sp.]